MNVAWISGRSGRAVVETESGVFLLIDGGESPPVACSPRQLSVQWSTYADVVCQNAGEFPFLPARASLAKAVAADRAHFYVLGLLDTELEDDLRSDLAADLDHLLADEDVIARVLATLRSAPLPADGDLHGGIELATVRGASRVVSLLAGLDADAPLIERACAAWTEFAASFRSDSEAEAARGWFARTGGFHQLVEGMRRDSREPFVKWMLSNARAVPRELGPVPLKALRQLQVLAGLPTGTGRDATAEYVREEHEVLEPKRPPREGKAPRLGAREVLARINTQVEEIIRRLEAGDEVMAGRFLDDLMEFQTKHGSTSEQRAKTLCNVAARARSIDRLDFAERLLHQALVERPDDGWAHSQLSAVLRAKGRLNEAHEAATLGQAYRPDAGGLTHIAEALKAQFRYAEALEKYDEAIERFPNHVLARNGRAEVLRAQGRYDEALASYDAITERFPDDVFAWNGRAEVLKAQGRYDEALDSYNQIIERFPDSVVARNGRAGVLKAQGQYDEALASYDATTRRFPDDVFARNGRAEVLKAQGRYDEALASYDEIAERFPDNAVARNGRADVLKTLGRYEEALVSYQAITERFPNDIVARNGRAEVLKAQGRYDEALDSYQETIDRFPDDVYARNGRAEVLKAQGRYQEALASYQAIIERYPDDVVGWSGRAEVLKAQGQYDEALASYDAISERFPDDVVAWTGRAEVLKAQGQYDEALASYDAITERFPDSVVAWNGRAEVLKAQGRYDEALASYDAITERFPDDVVARNGRAEVLKAQGRYDEARASYHEIVERFPDNAVARNGRAYVLLLVGQFEEAIRSLPSGEPRSLQDWTALHIRGMVSVRLGSLDEAQETFRRGASDAPTPQIRAYFRSALAAVQLRRRQFREVIRDLTPIVSEMPSDQRTTATMLLAHASGAIDERDRAQRWLDDSASTRVPVVVDLRAALAERYRLKVAGRTPLRTRPTAEIDQFIDEQEFRLLTFVQAA